jgi:hypothetical protein
VDKRVRNRGSSIRTEHYPTDPYEELHSCPWAPGYVERLKQLRVFDGLDNKDVWPAWRAIADAINYWGDDGSPTVGALRQKAANVACGSDTKQWADRSAASRALGIAADAARQQAQAATPPRTGGKKTSK